MTDGNFRAECEDCPWFEESNSARCVEKSAKDHERLTHHHHQTHLIDKILEKRRY